ncbi:MXAN_5187 family protein [Archangium primigenium]|uniref:MXAN_5187 family protein n=1 Tax=[Archangium] primigenium TaxID=2792470 RepID=UPI0019561886|nr:MXAN_5187 family protein [Archangium primigenium]MBM7117956.1 cell division protein FtsK [Archangium primigenium]
MVRLKFLLFALLVLGLGAIHLPLLSGPLSARAVEGAAASPTAAIAEVSRAMEARRSALQRVALALASSPDVATAVQPQVESLPKGKGIRIVEPPVGERFAALRTASAELVPESLKDSLVLALLTPDGALYSRAGGEPLADDAFDPRALLKVGAEGHVQDAFGAPHVFFSVPVLWNAEGGRSDVAATLVVGAPLFTPKMLDTATLSSGVAALMVLQGDKVIGTAGSESELAEHGRKTLIVGQSGHVVRRGSVRTLLPQLPHVWLPLLVRGDDWKGGEAPMSVGSRQPLGDGMEIVAVSSTRPFMTSLADYQQNALFALLGLVGASLLWTLLLGGGSHAAAPAADKASKGKGKAAVQPAPVAVAPVAQAAVAPAPVEPPSMSADDFPFPPPPPVQDAYATAPPVAEPAYDMAPPPTADAYPFASPATPVRDPFASPTVPGKDPFAALGAEPFAFPPAAPDANVPSAAPRKNAFEFEDHPTAAYSLQQAADPFAAAAAQAGLPSAFGDDEAPETTRVAAIPSELLARSARPMTAEVNLPIPPPPSGHPGMAAPTPFMGIPKQVMNMAVPPAAHTPVPMGAGAVALTEEQHFQDVFREFVVTREHCGEAQDGLTYDKFVAKLRKNKEQLVQKYACKTVRFQVYVKEGKAALKATPVKD